MENADDVLKLIKDHYSGKTVLQRMLKYDPVEGAQIDAHGALHFLSHGTSVGAYHRATGRLVGVLLSLCEDTEKPYESPVKIIEDERRKIKYRFVNCLENNMLQKLNAKKVMHTSLRTVHEDFQNLGISTKLFCATLEIAKEIDCDYVISVLTTSYFTKMPGLQIVNEIKYSEYVDEKTGLRPFKDVILKPHTSARVVAFSCKQNITELQ